MSFRKCAKIGKGGESLIGMHLSKNLEEWGIRNMNLENPAGDYYIDGNRELDEERKVNNTIGGNR